MRLQSDRPRLRIRILRDHRQVQLDRDLVVPRGNVHRIPVVVVLRVLGRILFGFLRSGEADVSAFAAHQRNTKRSGVVEVEGGDVDVGVECDDQSTPTPFPAEFFNEARHIALFDPQLTGALFISANELVHTLTGEITPGGTSTIGNRRQQILR